MTTFSGRPLIASFPLGIGARWLREFSERSGPLPVSGRAATSRRRAVAAQTPSSGGGGSDFVERQLSGCPPTALRTVIGVAPRSQQTAPLRVEHDHEGLRVGIDVETEVRPPFCGRRMAADIGAPEEAPEPHALGVEEPGAIARLDDDRFHPTIMPGEPGRNIRRVFRSCEA